MKGLLACIRKDIRLLIGSGWRALAMLLLPVLLTLAMFLGMADIANQRAHIEGFSIAIRDLDDTLMSRILINQLHDIELFETIYQVGQESDEEVFEQLEVAGILTIPKDFFFSLYDMRNYTVEIALNGNMPLETTIFQSLVASVMDIVSENQQMTWAVHTFAYGELDQAGRSELYQQASLRIVQDVLGRQGVFARERVVLDEATDTAIFLYGSILSVFLMFIPLCILKTLPEEMKIGILPRYIARGGSLIGLLVSKGLAALLICSPIWVLLTIFLFPFSWGMALGLFLSCFLASFALFLLISTLVQTPARSQLVGNVILLLFMVLGGALYPLRLLPENMQMASRFTIPYYFTMGLTGIRLELPLTSMFKMLWPLLTVTILMLLIAGMRLTRKGAGR